MEFINNLLFIHSSSFACASGECIEEDKECDGAVDCKDASDETNACLRIK